MSRLRVQLGQVEIFAEAGRLSSFKAAAESLSHTTSAVSQAVKKLEDRLGCQLFNRMGNKVSLTQDGELLLKHVSAGIDQIRSGVEAVASRASAPLSLSSPPGLASQLLPAILGQLLAVDSADVRLVADEKPDFSSYRNFDIALLYGEGGAGRSDLESLGPDVFWPVCRPDIASRIHTPADVLKFPLIVNESNSVVWQHWFDLNGVSGQPKKRIRLNRGAHILPALRDGVGIGLEPLRLLSGMVRSGGLALCELPGAKPISRELTYLFVTQDPVRRARAEPIAALIRDQSSTDERGMIKLK